MAPNSGKKYRICKAVRPAGDDMLPPGRFDCSIEFDRSLFLRRKSVPVPEGPPHREDVVKNLSAAIDKLEY